MLRCWGKGFVDLVLGVMGFGSVLALFKRLKDGIEIPEEKYAPMETQRVPIQRYYCPSCGELLRLNRTGAGKKLLEEYIRQGGRPFKETPSYFGPQRLPTRRHFLPISITSYLSLINLGRPFSG